MGAVHATDSYFISLICTIHRGVRNILCMVIWWFNKKLTGWEHLLKWFKWIVVVLFLCPKSNSFIFKISWHIRYSTYCWYTMPVEKNIIWFRTYCCCFFFFFFMEPVKREMKLHNVQIVRRFFWTFLNDELEKVIIDLSQIIRLIGMLSKREKKM